MEETPEPGIADLVIGVVIELLETEGYDGVRLREVARRSHLSLRTIYELFGNRDELILAAVERWMSDNIYGELAPPEPGEPVYDGIMRTLRYIYEPWERHPAMLKAYYRARMGPGGERLDAAGMRVVGAAGLTMIAGASPAYAADVGLILANMNYATIGRFASGLIDVADILPTLERVVFRITTDNRPEAAEAVERRAEAESASKAQPKPKPKPKETRRRAATGGRRPAPG
jgi:AcrR family transcriptional regulator